VVAKPKKRLPQNTRDGLDGLYILQRQLDLGIDVVIVTEVSVLMSLKWDHKALVKLPQRTPDKSAPLYHHLTLESE
jgi:hypothetical protein